MLPSCHVPVGLLHIIFAEASSAQGLYRSVTYTISNHIHNGFPCAWIATEYHVQENPVKCGIFL